MKKRARVVEVNKNSVEQLTTDDFNSFNIDGLVCRSELEQQVAVVNS